MKKYNHTKGISQRKKIVNYISRVDGTVVSANNIVWRKNSFGNKLTVINSKMFTHAEFTDEFTVYISREQELINETFKNFGDNLVNNLSNIAYLDYVAERMNGHVISNMNGRSYPENILKSAIQTFDLVACPGFSNVKTTEIEIVDYRSTNPKIGQTYYDTEEASWIFYNGTYWVTMDNDIVDSPTEYEFYAEKHSAVKVRVKPTSPETKLLPY